MQELRGSEIHYWTMKWSRLMGFKLRTLERGQCFTQIWDLHHIIRNWASLVAQLVKNPPAMRETWV